MIRISALLGLALLVNAACAEAPNELNSEEKKAGFKLLFNGTDLENWKQSGNWSVEDGVIARNSKGGGLIYAAGKLPDDFELRFQWKVAAGTNSGVYYRPGQYEYQVLDNDVHRDGKNARTSAASLYFCMPPSRDATKPVGQWNRGRIVCQGTVIQHWLNGQKVVGFDYADSKYAFEVDMLKKRGADLADRGAPLMFQDHGDPVWYRSIRMRTLSGDEQLDRTSVTPAEIPADVLAAEQVKLAGIVKKREEAKAKAKANQG